MNIDTLLMSKEDKARWEATPPERREKLYFGWPAVTWFWAGILLIGAGFTYFLGG